MLGAVLAERDKRIQAYISSQLNRVDYTKLPMVIVSGEKPVPVNNSVLV